MPRIKRLAAKVWRNRHAAAHNFSFLHGNIDFTTACVACHGVDFDPKCVLQKAGEEVVWARCPGCAALRRLGCLAYVENGSKWRVCARVEQHVAFLGRTYVVDLLDIKLDFPAAHELIQVNPVVRHSHREAVGLRDIVNVIHRNHRPGPRHVLHDDLGVARNVFRHVAGEEPSPTIVKAARCQADNDANGLSLVERFTLSMKVGDAEAPG